MIGGVQRDGFWVKLGQEGDAHLSNYATAEGSRIAFAREAAREALAGLGILHPPRRDVPLAELLGGNPPRPAQALNCGNWCGCTG